MCVVNYKMCLPVIVWDSIQQSKKCFTLLYTHIDAIGEGNGRKEGNV